MKINVMMTGLVANSENVKVFLRKLQKLKEQLIISDVFIEKNDSWEFNVEDLGFKFVEGSFPNPNKNDENYYNEIAKVKADKKRHVLNFIKNQTNFIEDSYIIYCRPDVYLDIELIREYANSIGKCTSNDLFGYRLLKDKIWVSNYDLLKPFYMNDLAYFAHVDDFDKLIQPPSCLVAYPRWDYGVSHIREFVSPFLKSYPEFDKYIKGHNDIISNLYHQGFLPDVNRFLDDPFYVDMMITYYKVLQEFFVIYGRRFEWDDYRRDEHFLNDYVFNKRLSFVDNIDKNISVGFRKAKGKDFIKDDTFFIYQGYDYTRYLLNPRKEINEA